MAPRTVRQLLDAAGDLDPLDAEVLLAAALGRNRAWLIAHGDDPIQAPHRYLDWINRRRSGEPVAYLTGWREFWSLRLRVTPDVLIPRPETELLVETALDRAMTGGRFLDLGTGSGAIALALATERPSAPIDAVDASLPALGVARDNARRLDLSNVELHHGDWYAALPGRRTYELVVSNPPYVAEDDDHLRRGDCAWEPRQALTPGGDGLDAYRAILAGVDDHLAPGGWLVVEHGHDQREAIAALFIASGLDDLEYVDDLAGIPRVIAGRRPSR